LALSSIYLTVAPDEGFITVHRTDFSDGTTWGFGGASNVTESIGGNSSNKLRINFNNDPGGIPSLKIFDNIIDGTQIRVAFDWYIGTPNDTNSGEVRIIDRNNSPIVTLRATGGQPLSIVAGRNDEIKTAVTDFNKWYSVEVIMNAGTYGITVTVTDVEANSEHKYETEVSPAFFTGRLWRLSVAGEPATGARINWTTYFDNFEIAHMPIQGNVIVEAVYIPIHRLFVSDDKYDVSQIGLPEIVDVLLVDETMGKAKVIEWRAVGEPWNPTKEGIFEFEGLLEGYEGSSNPFLRTARIWVYNRYRQIVFAREAEWLDRGLIAVNDGSGIFTSWRILSTEYETDITFNVYRNDVKINGEPLRVGNFKDGGGKPGDVYKVEAIIGGESFFSNDVLALMTDYLSIPLQKPTGSGGRDYTANDASVGDFTGNGQYDIVVKWDPGNSIDSAQGGSTGETVFDAYSLNGDLIWRIHMGRNLTSGAHYHPFLAYDFDGDGKANFFVKTADGTVSYGNTDGKVDYNKVLSEIGDRAMCGAYVFDNTGNAWGLNHSGREGHIGGGPEYVTVFDGTGRAIDTIPYRFSIEDTGVWSWGDGHYNRCDRFNAAVAYLDGERPSAVLQRGYYARTTLTAYELRDGKLIETNYFDSDEHNGHGAGKGNHSLSVADVTNNGKDDIILGAVVISNYMTVLHSMDNREWRPYRSHGDALHVSRMFPDRDEFFIYSPLEGGQGHYLREAATGEEYFYYHIGRDAGRGVAANITSRPGFEFWGVGLNIQTTTINPERDHIRVTVEQEANHNRIPMNFRLYWTGDLLSELLDGNSVSKYNEHTRTTSVIKTFDGATSNNGSKSTPCLTVDIFGDWREEVIMKSADSTELRIYTTTHETEYRMYTLMHDPTYRAAVAWQNSSYNQPPHLGFYLGEDIRDRVLNSELPVQPIIYTNGVFSSTADRAHNPNPAYVPLDGGGTDGGFNWWIIGAVGLGAGAVIAAAAAAVFVINKRKENAVEE
jgi:rhamnogalacturonan endolyase